MGGLNASMLMEDYLKLNPEFKQQTLNIYLEKGTDAEKFAVNLRDTTDKDIVNGVINFDKAMEEGMESYRSIVAIMGTVMLVITVFVVTLVLYFMISSSIIRKKRELGIQKAIGFTTFQLMNQISINFMIPIIIGTVLGSVLGALYTNGLLSVMMKGMGIMKAMFIVDIYWIVGFTIASILFSYILALLITWRIRKISAYELVTE
jgi:putative ABC transport system permease protein